MISLRGSTSTTSSRRAAPPAPPAFAAVLLAAVFWTAGCSGHRAPATPAAPAAPAEPAAEAAGSAPVTDSPPVPKSRLRDLCRQGTGGEAPLIDDTRRLLEETFCGATLWFDGLFGGEPDVENARAVSGRVELSTLYTEVDGVDPKGRLRLKYDLPNLEKRVNLFLGRDEEDEVVEDRQEGFAIRSSVFGLESEERWLAGLGYSPPGRWEEKVDFRVGVKLKSASEVFVQGRYRRNFFQGTNNVWRFRETVFWENREGYGSTTSLDFDRVLHRDLLLRWGNVGTFSESTEGLSWRSTALVYHNLRRSRAVAAEVFVRGTTGAEVPLREYGVRGVYRQPIGKPYLFGDLILGYTWPRFERDEPRDGSVTFGLGVELLFGRKPY